MRLSVFINEKGGILDDLAVCSDARDDIAELNCRINVYRKYIIKLKNDLSNSPTDAAKEEIKDKIYSIEAKIKKMKFRIADIAKKQVQSKRQTSQKNTQGV